MSQSPPTDVKVKAGDKSASVSFTAPTPAAGTTITKYTVTSSPGGIVATGTSSPIIVSNLTNGTAYTFTVTATNNAGSPVTSAPSTASESVKVNPQNSGLRSIFYICLVLVLIGALNWGLVSMDKDNDLVKMALGDYSMPSRVVYGLVGFSAVIVLILSVGAMSSIYATN
jgi:uncharacterized membrane protein YuzA (DUF378 family)